jgi:hypothetical protein
MLSSGRLGLKVGGRWWEGLDCRFVSFGDRVRTVEVLRYIVIEILSVQIFIVPTPAALQRDLRVLYSSFDYLYIIHSSPILETPTPSLSRLLQPIHIAHPTPQTSFPFLFLFLILKHQYPYTYRSQ